MSQRNFKVGYILLKPFLRDGAEDEVAKLPTLLAGRETLINEKGDQSDEKSQNLTKRHF